MSNHAHDKSRYKIKGKLKAVRYLKNVKVPAKALELNPDRNIYEFRIAVSRFLREVKKKTHYSNVFSIYIPWLGTVHTHGNKQVQKLSVVKKINRKNYKKRKKLGKLK